MTGIASLVLVAVAIAGAIAGAGAGAEADVECVVKRLEQKEPEVKKTTNLTIGFGSCNNPILPQPAWQWMDDLDLLVFHGWFRRAAKKKETKNKKGTRFPSTTQPLMAAGLFPWALPN